MTSLIRRVVHRLVDLTEPLWRSTPLLPPAHLRRTYYRDPHPDVFARACVVAANELLQRGLQPHHRILEIGCGIANLALGLRDFLTEGSYDGLDIHGEAIRWCQRTVTTRWPRLRFLRADVRSKPYNPRGRFSAGNYQFPFLDDQFDVVFLGSVFTHMLPDGVANYLSEIVRVLKPQGFCVISYFLLNEPSRLGVEAGHSFLSFPILHDSTLCRLHDSTQPEMAVALEEPFVLREYHRLGLELTEPIRRGGWWSGTAHDQDVITAAKRSRPLDGL
jgi:SAM-dependent methyltransferase